MRHTRESSTPDDEVTRRARARIGTVVRERWHLDTLLGVGGMAAVYAATHRNNGKRVAIKMLHLELSTSSEIRRRFIDEGYAANRVAHRGAVSVLDDDVAEDGAAFLVMDLLEGETLEARLQRLGRLDPLQVLGVADALLDVLASAHAQGIVHRDIKPDNVFITTEGVVMLLDFGIARMIVEGRPRTTVSGATMGTPAFMAPEQARGRWEDIDGRTDLWALGATMFVQLTGRVVHEAETTNEELLCAMTKRAPSLAAVAPHLPRVLIDVIDRALAFEQGDRWEDARAMQAAVRQAYEQVHAGPAVNEPTSPQELTHSTSPHTFLTPHELVSTTDSHAEHSLASSRGRKRLWIGGVPLAAAAIVLAFSLRQQRPTTPAGPTSAPLPPTSHLQQPPVADTHVLAVPHELATAAATAVPAENLEGADVTPVTAGESSTRLAVDPRAPSRSTSWRPSAARRDAKLAASAAVIDAPAPAVGTAAGTPAMATAAAAPLVANTTATPNRPTKPPIDPLERRK